MNEEIKKKINELYENTFFLDGFADRITGVVSGTEKKIATYPYIGEKYGEKTKILIVGLDMGIDETPNEIQSFEKRNRIKNFKTSNGDFDMNHHMAGSYFTAMYYLKNEIDFNSFFERTKNESIFKTIMKRHFNELLSKENPLDYVCLVNFYKYVTVGRAETRRGSQDRIYIDQKREIDLFQSEIEIFDPQIIFFQSWDFYNYKRELLESLKRDNRKIVVGFHPSAVLPKLKYPEVYFSEYCKEI